MSIGAKGIHNTGGLIAFRFCLGLLEAGFFPGVMLLLSCWYKVRNGYLYAMNFADSCNSPTSCRND
jgi:MFS family permease